MTEYKPIRAYDANKKVIDIERVEPGTITSKEGETYPCVRIYGTMDGENICLTTSSRSVIHQMLDLRGSMVRTYYITKKGHIFKRDSVPGDLLDEILREWKELLHGGKDGYQKDSTD
jgi:hypothetical protein